MTVQRVLRTLSIVAVAAMVTACSSPEKKKAQFLQAGDALVAQNKHAEAIIEYKNAIKQDDHFGEARFKLAKLVRAGQGFRQSAEGIRACRRPHARQP